jgi:hypothetical protein
MTKGELIEVLDNVPDDALVWIMGKRIGVVAHCPQDRNYLDRLDDDIVLHESIRSFDAEDFSRDRPIDILYQAVSLDDAAWEKELKRRRQMEEFLASP